MKKLIMMFIVLGALTGSVHAGVNFDQQNWELDMVTVGDGDC